ncbi:toluene hydroxylase [Sphingopyxis sp. OPL5]|uniref:toluene hydroxylase n=1 Tax=Sphingopyxis sp. OPL5 TaxID=2486273 RepID=UPI00164CE278|nr:toluene hydroxylase [Sphingopyxis sp. OPL5]QNO27222.1 toluene hydroxylase [Sphingopyxis sp. OPL5]
MSGAVTRIGRNRAKTWSSFGNLGRKPSEYEVVTHNMNHTYRNDGGQPLEMGPDVPGNVWLREHRDAKLFGVTAWNDFRDPDELTYRKYCQLQDEQETYVDELLRNFTEVKKADGRLDDTALTFLQTAMTPCRYLAHGQQMLSSYVQQLAPSSYVGNCATFQTADTLRRVQRIAYRTKQLDNAHPMRGFGTGERAIWEKDAGWQPIRKAIEQLMLVYDFDRAFVGYELCVRPVLDNIFLQQFAIVARSLGAETDALIAENLYVDTVRANRWSIAVARFVIAQAPDARSEMRTLVAESRGRVDEIVQAGTDLITRYVTGATAEAYSVREEKSLFGKGKPASAAIAETMRSRVRTDWSALINEAELGSDA